MTPSSGLGYYRGYSPGHGQTPGSLPSTGRELVRDPPHGHMDINPSPHLPSPSGPPLQIPLSGRPIPNVNQQSPTSGPPYNQTSSHPSHHRTLSNSNHSHHSPPFPSQMSHPPQQSHLSSHSTHSSQQSHQQGYSPIAYSAPSAQGSPYPPQSSPPLPPPPLSSISSSRSPYLSSGSTNSNSGTTSLRISQPSSTTSESNSLPLQRSYSIPALSPSIPATHPPPFLQSQSSHDSFHRSTPFSTSHQAPQPPSTLNILSKRDLSSPIRMIIGNSKISPSLISLPSHLIKKESNLIVLPTPLPPSSFSTNSSTSTGLSATTRIRRKVNKRGGHDKHLSPPLMKRSTREGEDELGISSISSRDVKRKR